jgi:hypothetical protein
MTSGRRKAVGIERDDLDRVVSPFRGNFRLAAICALPGRTRPDFPPDYRRHGISPP